METLSDEIRFQNRILEIKIESERKLVSFVSDRTFIDAAAYWLYHLSKKTSEKQSNSYLRRCQELMSNYHIVIFLSYDRLGGCLVDDGVRTNKLYYNYSMHLLMKGLLADWKIIYFQIDNENNDLAFEYLGKMMGR